MPTGVALSVLLTKLKAEIGNTMTADVAVADDVRLKQLLANKQIELCSLYDWAHLRTRLDVASVGGTKTYTLPAINFQRPYSAQVKWNTVWRPITYGINEEDYNLIDSLTVPPTTVDPIMKWLQTSATEFEVWPVPVTVQTIRFTGQAMPAVFVVDADLCSLDDLLLVYLCAAEEATRRESADSPLKLQKAQMRLSALRASVPARSSVFVIGEENDNNFGRSNRGKRVLMG